MFCYCYSCSSNLAISWSRSHKRYVWSMLVIKKKSLIPFLNIGELLYTVFNSFRSQGSPKHPLPHAKWCPADMEEQEVLPRMYTAPARPPNPWAPQPLFPGPTHWIFVSYTMLFTSGILSPKTRALSWHVGHIFKSNFPGYLLLSFLFKEHLLFSFKETNKKNFLEMKQCLK